MARACITRKLRQSPRPFPTHPHPPPPRIPRLPPPSVLFPNPFPPPFPSPASSLCRPHHPSSRKSHGRQARYRYRRRPEKGTGGRRCCGWFVARRWMGAGSKEADKSGCARGFAPVCAFHAARGFVFKRSCARETGSGKVYRESPGLCREQKGVSVHVVIWRLHFSFLSF